MITSEKKWLSIMRREVEKSNITQVANAIGYSRTAVSLALIGKYQGKTDKIEQAVLDAFAGQICCPHLGKEINRSSCEAFATAPMPLSQASKLRHWMACVDCPQATNQKGKSHDDRYPIDL